MLLLVFLLTCLTLCATAEESLVVRSWGSLRLDGDPIQEALDISATHFGVIVRLADGRIRTWGHNNWGQIDAPRHLPPVAQVASGLASFSVVTAEGKVVRWGRRPVELDLSSLDQHVKMVSEHYVLLENNIVLNDDKEEIARGIVFISEQHIGYGNGLLLMLTEDGDVISHSMGRGINPGNPRSLMYQTPRFPGRVRRIATGLSLNLALLDDGNLVVWGLAVGDDPHVIPTDRAGEVVAIAVGTTHGLFLRSDGTVWTIHRAEPDKSDDNRVDISAIVVEMIDGLPQVRAIAAGAGISYVVSSSGDVIGLGLDGRAILEMPGSINAVRAVSESIHHRLLLTKHGSIRGSGCDQFGAIQCPEGGRFTAIATGLNHSLARTNEGAVVVWGGVHRSSAGSVMDMRDRSIRTLSWAELITESDYQPHQALLPVTAIASGPCSAFSAAIASADGINGRLYVWGMRDPLLPVDATEYHRYPVHTSSPRHPEQPVVWAFRKQHPRFIHTRAPFSAIATGEDFVLALQNDGSLAFFGQGRKGAGHIPTIVQEGIVRSIAAGQHICLALMEDGTVIEWGDDGIPESYAIPVGLDDVVAIDAAGAHRMALRADGTVVSWGAAGQQSIFTGRNTFHDNRYDISPPQDLRNVVRIAAGPTTGWAWVQQ